MNRLKVLLFGVLLSLAAPLAALGQDQSKPQLDDITISPSRVELVMAPGTERTVTVKLIYTSVSGQAPPARIRAYIGDWDMTREGEVTFHKAGTLPNSASPWMIHTPGEMTVEPGNVHVIRVTVSVPKDATPGDHLAVLFVEPRPEDLKLLGNTKQVQVKFRMGAIFYVMVPELARKPALENLKAEMGQKGILVTPRLTNQGNSHVRPLHSIQVTDRAGAVVAELSDVESIPVLAGKELEAPVLIEQSLPEGSYSVRYRVRFGEREALTEGVTDLIVRKEVAEKKEPETKTASPARPAQPTKQSGGLKQ
ncbi:MAG TPA: hypothetical protein VE262_12295 [Blastocatellia bacterium]|nr:hypothetical protein [Blastocatellia bacterium]